MQSYGIKMNVPKKSGIHFHFEATHILLIFSTLKFFRVYISFSSGFYQEKIV